MTDMSDAFLDAALQHVPFDGWSEATFVAAAADVDAPLAQARALFPRGAVDLAMAFHRRADRALALALSETDLATMRFRERVAHAVKLRLELVAGEKEAVRRGATLFALPIHAADGAKLMWETADVIWTALGDSSDDLNWYTKRATLAGVYSATVLYWLGDQSEGHIATWAFLDRRIGDVMKIEEIKAKVRNSAMLKPFATGFERFAASVRAPRAKGQDDLPGRWTPPT
ncbi:COQ9 family protein [Gymnodinialimonas ceratoperidinii]|uniref:COQ9 family protein n=1 Tax=Gymnodinialimonas ceratoperidinii TaxID=2856823 RepID=A0A8F6TY70_9RHOB|nr:COQ9 family protein [Gymnodinialimonas ceratoperidinii]QXT40354.1 COQ9 family protein [Gymnodinialimonas ceratoperidinii]